MKKENKTNLNFKKNKELQRKSEQFSTWLISGQSFPASTMEKYNSCQTKSHNKSIVGGWADTKGPACAANRVRKENEVVTCQGRPGVQPKTESSNTSVLFKTSEASGRTSPGSSTRLPVGEAGQGSAAQLVKPLALYTISTYTLDPNKNFSKTRLKAKIRDTSGKELQYQKLKKKILKPYFTYYHSLEPS